MKEFLSKNRIGVSLVVFFFIVLPGIVWGVLWMSGQLDEKKQKIAEHELAREVRIEQVGSLDDFRAQEKLIESKKETLSVFLENSDEAKVGLADRIDAIAKQEGLTLVIDAQKETLGDLAKKTDAGGKTVASGRGGKTPPSSNDASGEVTVTPEPFVGPAGENYITLNIETTGTFGEVTRFLYKVEHMEYFNDVLALSLKKKNQRQENSRVGGSSDTGEEQGDAVAAQIEVVFYLE